MADGAHGPENAMQCMWSEVQVGSVGTRVPTRFQPDVRADEALELAPQGDGAPTPERDADEGGPAAPAVSATSKHGVRL